MTTNSSSPVVVGVTGATGRVGGAVAGLLRHAHVHQRLIVRDPSRAPLWARLDQELTAVRSDEAAPAALPTATVAVAEYGDLAAARAALEGVRVLLMVSAAESEDRLEQHRTLIDAARLAGVEHVVYTSFLGAAPDATFTLARDHWATEEHLRRSGMTWTMLRDSFYLDFLPDLAVDGVIAGPAGEGRVGAVARADVARAASAVLLDVVTGSSRHDGATYELTGPAALTLAEAAHTISEVTGIPTAYREESVEEAYASRTSYDAPQWQLDAWVSTYTAIASGELAAVTDDVRRLTSRAPLSLEQLLRGDS
ncbi:SDR family oxidoreductase [Actinomyces radicidentis]|uniref:NAD(P)-dependent oxidoreductase n=1 Tax=Actinomyces radicidentis TaxID=111015 RepID=A0A0X8JFJ6_ACTRD|nr:SDR family oxidoreductase [Actinomyces radicidentis]AMD87923.1 NAD(P)-dependent oxidoreductase [Actinomyces radicidentis]